MFDLFRSRAKAVRYLLGGLLGIVALSMVITLIPGWNAPAANSGTDNIVAEIGKSALTVRDVETEMQAMVRGRQVPPELIPVYLPQKIDQMINERALAYQAERMGYSVPDSELAAYIRSMLPQLFPNGQLADRAAYERFLNDQGFTIQEFESNLRKQLLQTRLLSLALEGIVVTPEEVKQEYERRNAKVKIAYVGFRAEALKSQIKGTPAELEAYYNQNKNGFMEPEKRDIVVLIADQDKIAASLNIPEEQLRRAYEQRKDQFRTPDRARARHILFMTQGKSADETAKIKAKAEAVRKQINNTNFADLAQANSDDPGSKEKGGELGFLAHGQTVPNFDKALFSQKIGDISQLITTEYGFHIIQVEERQDARVQPFEEVKAKLALDLKGTTVADKVQTSIDQARAALAKAPQNYEQIAQQYGLDVVKAEKVAPGAPVGSLGVSAELDQALAGLKAGEVSPVFQLAATKLAAAELAAVTPARVMTFAEAEARVKDAYAGFKVLGLIADRAKAASDRAKAGEDLAKIAKDLGGEYKTPAEFNADGAVEGLGAATTMSDAFTKPVGAILGPMNVAGQQVVAKVLEKAPADPGGLAGQRDEIVLALKRKKSLERRDLFQDSILAQLLKDGKVKKHEDTIKRLMTSYRRSS